MPKTAKKTTSDKKRTKVTIREKVFKFLKENKGATGREIRDKFSLGGVPAFLKDEVMAKSPRIKREKREDVRGVIYKLTPDGTKALSKGIVNSEAPDRTSGKAIPNNR